MIEALCVEHQIPILKIGDNKTLGEWSGLCKIDREGKFLSVGIRFFEDISISRTSSNGRYREAICSSESEPTLVAIFSIRIPSSNRYDFEESLEHITKPFFIETNDYTLGNAVKVVGCSCVVVREVDDNAAWDYLQTHLKKH